ncbi:MAG: hypothetical protein K5681_08845 [Treponema sp.]|nr:hypothetical protein [Treponema sp.]
MKSYFKIASPFIIILSILAIFTFRTLPASKLWNNYAVVYVPIESDDRAVIQAIENANITDAVLCSGQFLPLDIDRNSLEYSIYNFNKTSSDFDYRNQRLAYFFDKSNQYRLYYIPSSQKAKISDLLGLLSVQGIKAGADTSASYPWILPLISAILVIALFMFSKNPLLFLASAFIPVLNLFCNPFYQMAEATCLLLLCLFFISNVWQRRGAVAYLLGNHSIPLMLLVSLLAAFTCTIKTGLLFIFALAGTSAILITIKAIEDYINSKRSFVPVYIRPAKKVSIFASKVNIIMPLFTTAALIIFAVIFLSSITGSNTKSSTKLMLPANTKGAAELPQLEDYYKFAWNVKSYPYRNLNQEYDNNLYFEYPKYKEDKGLIREQSLVMAYNDSFKESVYENIDSLNFNSIEKVIKSEGKDFRGGYSATNSYNVDLFGVIMSLICVFILLFIYISTIIRKGMKK